MSDQINFIFGLDAKAQKCKHAISITKNVSGIINLYPPSPPKKKPGQIFINSKGFTNYVNVYFSYM